MDAIHISFCFANFENQKCSRYEIFVIYSDSSDIFSLSEIFTTGQIQTTTKVYDSFVSLAGTIGGVLNGIYGILSALFFI